MATTTTNFGWDIPQSTDLVKDGATAIAALGQDIDTALVDLKGGTTGQVLAKASNTDLDYSWVAQDDSNAIQNAIVDAKGDLIAASAADTPARLAVGANGETLVADSSTTTGLRYQTGVNLNGVINGGMDIWQRGISFAIPSSTYTYTADRWIGLRFSTGATVSQQTASLDGFQYSARVARDSGNSGLGIIYFGYNLETADSYKYAGKTVTLSFWAKAGADFSSASSALSVVWASGTGTNQKQMDGFTGSSSLANSSVTLTTLWQRFSFTAAVPSNSTQQGFQFNYTPVGTAGVADNFEVVGVQLEFGSVATNFKRAGGGTIQGELAAAQRYYYRQSASQVYASFSNWASAYTTSIVDNWLISFPVTMRVPQTSGGSLTVSNISVTDGNNTFSTGTFNLATTAQSVWGAAVRYQHGTAALTQYRSYQIIANNNAAAFIEFSAEL
jgi:hypothetical protein